MKLSDFNYTLPRELIAQYPLKERDAARLLVLNRTQGTIQHHSFKDTIDYLCKGDLLVLNNTRVLRCRLKGRRRSGGKVEVLLLNRKVGLTFGTLIKPSRIRVGEEIIFTPPFFRRKSYSGQERAGFNGDKILGEVTAKGEVTFHAPDMDAVYNLGKIPLPPYIKRDPEDLDEVYYQTVYARNKGSIASPTAGLHFTKELLVKIKSYGINIAYITLNIGYSTFKPVETEDVTKHKMEPEYFQMPQGTQRLIGYMRSVKGRIFAVGTTSLRALETYASASGIRQGYTDLFIYPGYKFKLTDGLLTNFHLPRTTLFILACAFAGERLIKRAYQEAIDKKYRFYSYGDAMLIV